MVDIDTCSARLSILCGPKLVPHGSNASSDFQGTVWYLPRQVCSPQHWNHRTHAESRCLGLCPPLPHTTLVRMHTCKASWAKVSEYKEAYLQRPLILFGSAIVLIVIDMFNAVEKASMLGHAQRNARRANLRHRHHGDATNNVLCHVVMWIASAIVHEFLTRGPSSVVDISHVSFIAWVAHGEL
jgi:hypothetical protein